MKTKIVTALDQLKTGISNVWSNIKDTITDSKIWDMTIGNIKRFINNVKDNFSGLPEKLYSVWNGLKEGVQDFWTGILDDLKLKFQNIIDWIPDKIDTIVDSVTQIWSDIKTFLTENDLYDIGRNIIVSLAEGIRDAFGHAIETVKEVVGNLYKAAKEKLDMNSPSKVFMDIGAGVGEGMELGIENRKSKVAQKAREMASAAIDNVGIDKLKIAGMSGGASAALQTQAYNTSNVNNNNFQPNISMQLPSDLSPSEERRKQEQLLRKLGAEFNR